MFPRAQTDILSYGNPILSTASNVIAVPQNAISMLAYIVGGGGSGGVAVSGVSSTAGASGAGSGAGVFIQIDLVSYRKTASAASLSTQLFVTNTIGAGGLAVSQTTLGSLTGNTGGSTTFVLTGGVSIVVTGGIGGVGFISSGGLSGASPGTCAAAASYYQTDYVQIQKLALPQASGADTGATGGAATNTISSESGSSGGVFASTGVVSILYPWFLQAVGITSSTGGTGSQVTSGGKAAGGGAGGIGGSGGNAAVLNAAGTVTAGSGTGYGSGGGGAAGVTGSTVTSGAGAGGCSVIVFRFGA